MAQVFRGVSGLSRNAVGSVTETCYDLALMLPLPMLQVGLPLQLRMLG